MTVIDQNVRRQPGAYWDGAHVDAKKARRNAALDKSVSARLEKRLKDYSIGGLSLLWKRQSMYVFAAILAAAYVSVTLAVVSFLLCQVAELLDYLVSRKVAAWSNGTWGEAIRFKRLLGIASTFSALAVSAFCIGFALLEGPIPHQMPLFILFSAGLFAAVNNHQIPQILYVRLIIYGAAFLFIPIYDLVLERPPLTSRLWLQLGVALFVLYFVIECAQIYLKLYRGGLDQLDKLREERDRVQAAYEVKSQFVSVVSHELRTPLTSIIGSLDLLNHGLLEAAPDKAKKLIEIGASNGHRLKNLINDLLDLQKIESSSMPFSMQDTSLNDLVTEAVESAKVVADKKDITLACDTCEGSALVRADHARLNQVLNNLLCNAIKFSSGPSTVTVRTWETRDTTCVSVADTGIGIPPNSESIVFGSFTQVEAHETRSYEGTGLGMSIVKKIVDGHGGTISYVSELGKGTVFTVELPRGNEA